MRVMRDSMLISMWLVFLIEVAFPLMLLFHVQRASSRVRLISSIAFASSFLAFMYVVFPWSISSVYLRYVFPVALLALSVVHIARWSSLPWLPPSESVSGRMTFWGGVLLDAGLAAVVLYMLLKGVAGYHISEGIELHPPVRRGFVFHGGASSLINYHYVDKAQRYAMDIQGLYWWGGRARGPYPLELDGYAIFGDTVYSPCDCRVVRVVNGLEDNPPGVMDTVNLAGNHVVLALERDGRT